MGSWSASHFLLLITFPKLFQEQQMAHGTFL